MNTINRKLWGNDIINSLICILISSAHEMFCCINYKNSKFHNFLIFYPMLIKSSLLNNNNKKQTSEPDSPLRQDQCSTSIGMWINYIDGLTFNSFQTDPSGENGIRQRQKTIIIWPRFPQFVARGYEQSSFLTHSLQELKHYTIYITIYLLNNATRFSTN